MTETELSPSTVRLACLVQLRDTVRVEAADTGEILLIGQTQQASLGDLASLQRRLLDDVRDHECDEEAMIAGAQADAGQAGLRAAYALFSQLREGNWLAATLTHDGLRLLTLCPLAAPAGDDPRSAGDVLADVIADPAAGVDRPLVLSRFALLRRDGDQLVLESPRSRFAVRLHQPALLALLGTLGTPTPLDRLPVPSGLDDRSLAATVSTLVAVDLVVPAGSIEDTDLALRQWSPHELWFHARSRQGRNDGPWGATYWADRTFAPLPAHKPATGPVRSLPTPDLATLAAGDPSLTTVLEARRSVRRHDDGSPLTYTELGEFLYRTARTRRTSVRGGIERADRPYPSGGGVHELELYLAVDTVTDLDPGLYRYDSGAHELEWIAEDGPLIRRLIGRAADAADMTGQPQLLIVIAARFGRVMWQYQSMAYALTLKNVGVLMSSMYAVATAMGLAPCALGGGDSDLFAQAAGLDYLIESSVGEFLLGSAAE